MAPKAKPIKPKEEHKKPAKKSPSVKKTTPATPAKTPSKASRSSPKLPSPVKEIPRASQAQNLPPGFPIVGIGASAGGLEAFEEFFTQMPPNSGLAFVVVPHQSPTHTSLLPGLLQKCTSMPVLEVSDGLAVKPNTVYTSLAGKYLALLNGKLQLMETASQDQLHYTYPSITFSDPWLKIKSIGQLALFCRGRGLMARWV